MPRASYEVVAVSKKTGKVTSMTEGHLTRKEAMTIKSKLTVHPLRTIKVRKV